jgi:hypothetical protein
MAVWLINSTLHPPLYIMHLPHATIRQAAYRLNIAIRNTSWGYWNKAKNTYTDWRSWRRAQNKPTDWTLWYGALNKPRLGTLTQGPGQSHILEITTQGPE